MKFSITLASLIVGSAIHTQGSHVLRENTASNASELKAPRSGIDNKHGQVAGAAYFMTNHPEGNFIISCDIGKNGKLTYRDTLSTGGNGAHAIDSGVPFTPDALFSQNSVKVSGEQVFVVNAGSQTMAMFSLDQTDPAKLRMVGHPVDTGGEFPISIAVSKHSGQVCVLNGGKTNGVNCFTQNNIQGLLRLHDTKRELHFNQTTPAIGPAGSLSEIVFSDDGHQLMALAKGLPGMSPGQILIWDVDAKTGALSKQFTSVHGGILPFSMTFIPGTNAILSTDPGVGFDIWDFKNPKNASVHSFPIPGQSQTCWSSFSPKTGNFYLSDLGVGRVTEVHIDRHLKGSVVNQYSQGNDSFLSENNVATINKHDYLYVLAPGVTSITVLSLDGPGKAKMVQNFSIADAIREPDVKIDGNYLEGMGIFIKRD